LKKEYEKLTQQIAAVFENPMVFDLICRMRKKSKNYCKCLLGAKTIMHTWRRPTGKETPSLLKKYKKPEPLFRLFKNIDILCMLVFTEL